MLITKSPFIIRLGLVAFSLVLRLTIHRAGFIWVTYTLVIMFLGGIIIVFIYASSINSVFKLMVKRYKVVIFSTTLVLPCFLTWGGFLNSGQVSSTPVWLNFCCRSTTVLCVIAMLILLTLFIVVKLVQVLEGPLKF